MKNTVPARKVPEGAKVTRFGSHDVLARGEGPYIVDGNRECHPGERYLDCHGRDGSKKPLVLDKDINVTYADGR